MQTNDTGAAAPLDLKPPVAVQNVSPEAANASIPLTQADKAKIDAQVKSQVQGLMTADVHSDAFRQRIEQIGALAQDEIRKSAASSNRLLDRPTRSLQEGGISQGSKVGKDLVALRGEMEKLDPSKLNLAGATRKILGIIPFGMGNKIENYMRSYQSAQTQINAIVEALYRGKDEILRDNASIDEEKARIWDEMVNLRKYAAFAEQMDDEISGQIASLKATDPERARILEEEVLFRLRQRRQDIMTQAAVNTQGYMSMDLVRRNNTELAMAVERTTTTTLSALRTAVITAQALSSQKDVIAQVSATNDITNKTILATSEMLKQNAGAVADLSTKPAIAVETLQKSFDNVFAAMDTTDNYRIKALESMKATIDGLQGQVERARTYLDKERDGVLSATVTPAIGAIKID